LKGIGDWFCENLQDMVKWPSILWDPKNCPLNRFWDYNGKRTWMGQKLCAKFVSWPCIPAILMQK
jgi:hypothetical protein